MNVIRKGRSLLFILLLIWAGSLLFIGFQIERTQTVLLFSLFGIGFLAYATLLKISGTSSFKTILAVAILVRLALLFAFPKLSDDIYRFIWDGQCWYYGIHAFSYTPAEVIKLYPQLSGFSPDLYKHLNSTGHYTIYPAVCQLIFYISVLICPDGIIGSTILIKLFLLIIDFVGVYYLIKLLDYHQWNRNRVFIYVLNPLVVIEIFGNVHFEGAMIAFFIIALYYLHTRSKQMSSAIYWSLGIASKMVTAIFLPIWLFREEDKKNRSLYLWIMLFNIPLWYFILLCPNIFDSIDLYFQNFEFNASVYYVVRWVGTAIKGYNPIHTVGPILGIITLILCLVIAYLKRKDKLPYLAMLLMFTSYLFLATTVHPWYVITLVLLSSFTGYLYPLVWSGLIILSYANYKVGAYHEELVLVGIEYSIVLFTMLYEIIKRPILSPTRLFQIRQ